ncbi:MAG: hypothetical protein DWQ31_14830 [Planctomycetota bacterium]|nr:MAG: hypothetical protein DWQ31_14830 [Planctomycetota bacterium]REJ87533.1 MAG: hypothetical protein DWQ35_21345 [Planctomycetota bacterium]
METGGQSVDSGQPQDLRPRSGKPIVVVVLLFAVALAGFGWWFTYQRTRRVAEFFGTEAIRVISDPETVMALVLRLDDGVTNEMRPRIEFAGNSYVVTDDKLVVDKGDFTAPGFMNACNSLTNNASYDWEPESKNTCEPIWTYALRFENDEGSAVLLMSLECPRVALAGEMDSIPLSEKIAAGFAGILQTEFATEQDGDAYDNLLDTDDLPL